MSSSASDAVGDEVAGAEGLPLGREARIPASIVPESRPGRTLSQFSVCSGPSSQGAGAEKQMDASVCRKRKDRPPPEQGRSHSADHLSGRSNRKVFKTPNAPSGRHGRLPVPVMGRPSALPVRTSALPVRT